MSWDARESPGLTRGGIINRTDLGRRLAAAGAALTVLAGAQLAEPTRTPSAAAAPSVEVAPVQSDLDLLRAERASRAATRTPAAAPATKQVERQAKPVRERTRPAVKAKRTRPATQEHRTARKAPARHVTKHRKVVKRTRAHKAPRVTYRGAGRAAAVIRYAYAQLGDPYVYGAEGPGAWDCSGLTKAAYARAGIRMAHKAAAQGRRGYTVSRRSARPGDLVKWGSYHVGIYIGRGRVIHAPKPGDHVKVSSLWGSYRIVRVIR